MKKLLYIGTILISILIFYTSFSISSLTNKLYNQFSAPTNYTNVEGKETLALRFMNIKEDDAVFIYHNLIDLASQYDFTLTLSKTTSTNLISTYDHYLFSRDKESLSQIYMMKGREIDFSQDTTDYYSSDIYDQQAYDYIDYVDNRKVKSNGKDVIRIHQLSECLEYIKGQTFIGVMLASNDPDAALQILKNSNLNQYLNITSIKNLNNSNVSRNEMGLFGVDNEIYYNYALTTIVFVLFVLLVFNYISHKLKDISIQLLHGKSVTRISNGMFLKTMLLCVLLYAVVQVVMFSAFCGSIRPVNYALRVQLMYFLSIYVLVLICAYVISLLYMKKINIMNGMKQRKMNKNIIDTCLIMKAVVTVIIIMPFVNLQEFVIKDFPPAFSIFLRKDKLNEYAHISNIEFTNDMFLNEKLKVDLYEVLNEHGAKYSDFNSYITSLGQAESEDAVIYPFISVNKNYLQEYELLNTAGDIIDLDSIDDIVYFVPESAKDIDLNELHYFYYEEDRVIYIKDPGYIDSLLPMYYASDNPLEVKNPVIGYFPNTAGKLNNIDQFNTFINIEENLDDVEDALEQEGLSDYISFIKNETEVNIAVDYYADKVASFSIMLCVYLMTYISMLYLNVTIYINEFKIKLALGYLNGYSYIFRYGKLLCLNFIVYLVPLAFSVGVLNQSFVSVLCYLCFFTLVELLIEVIMIHKFHKKGIIRVLKGE